MAQEKNLARDLSPNAFLIVNGSDVFPLNKPIVTIGRMEDNDLTIPEVRISRYHAQLRVINGQHILIDLKSTGGTSVNGEKIGQTVLSPGDVISLAGIPVIYGQSPAVQIQEGESPEQGARFNRTDQPTKAITDSVELTSIDNYLDMFEDLTDEK
jgi:pSer/pThr/pTyr-binding forkhead associated (FHA) protein